MTIIRPIIIIDKVNEKTTLEKTDITRKHTNCSHAYNYSLHKKVI